MSIRLITGDCREVLPTLAPESVQCAVTSPPYWGLRDYGVAGQIGLEREVQTYIAALVAVFREVRRVLRPDGTLWLNLGDCYATGAGKVGGCPGGGAQGARWMGRDDSKGRGTPIKAGGKRRKDGVYLGPVTQPNRLPQAGLKPKDLVMLPARVALALQADGWWLRSEIVWAKPNPMPESVTDRPTSAHEKVYLLAKSARYVYDAEAVKQPASFPDGPHAPDAIKSPYGQGFARRAKSGNKARKHDHDGGRGQGHSVPWEGATANLKNVWHIATRPFNEAHFATFPPELAERCIKAGCPKGGVVLDPFAGAGTTGLVADRLGRDAVLIELNPEYSAIAARRIETDAGMFGEIAAS